MITYSQEFINVIKNIFIYMDTNNHDDVIGTIILKDNKINNIPETYVKNYTLYKIKSSIDEKMRSIFIINKQYEGSFNKIYSFSLKNNTIPEKNLLIRILNLNANQNNIKNEINGIEIQYKLCSLINNIGYVIDYGKIFVGSQIQDYFVLQKYSMSLTDVLKTNPSYKNLLNPLTFIRNILFSINLVHQKKIAHLDLKPCNILIKNRDNTNINDTKDFAIIDFGCAQIFKDDSSVYIKKQSGSEGFSPPEFSKMKFGIKTDIWALGIIFYMILVRKFYFEAGIQDIFYTKINRKSRIDKHLDNLWKYVIPENKNSETEIKDYIYPFTLESVDYLIDFFKQIFIIEDKQRMNSNQLLKHKIFSLINV